MVCRRPLWRFGDGLLEPDDHPAWASVLRHAQARLVDPATLDPFRHPATSTADADRRLPGAELDRWVRTRDRRCIGVMCTRPAHSNDLDHTRDWALGGPTVAANLGAPCRHCHRLKHSGRWRLTQPRPGWFRWASRAGATYTVRPRPIMRPLAAPCPRPDGRPRIPVEERCAPVALADDHPDAHLDDTPAWIPLPDPTTSRRRTRPDPEPGIDPEPGHDTEARPPDAFDLLPPDHPWHRDRPDTPSRPVVYSDEPPF